eukprot:TRINITY_DN7598_c0_g1_i2.p1 TRINITY_DN7598_c0_g1~~TRINITY_DN7598_c0_g1_i2.p1  ORF type:complete len:403 (+),score=62.63 TRINITY_DN7598_c0_g1_i2:49-1257(+)
MPAEECGICMCEDSTIHLPCGHSACQDCAVVAFRQDIVKGKVPVQCFGCKEEVPLEVLLTVLATYPDLVEKVHRYGLQRALQRDPNVRLCPHPNCPYAVILSRAVSKKREVKCECCHEGFCIKCRQPAHEGPCSFYDEDDVKPCPECNTHIYKEQDASCNAMYCTVCHTEFCWLCGAKLGVHGMSHFFGLRGCTMYGKERWSLDRIRRKRRWSPVVYPLGMAGAAVAAPLMIVALPVVMAAEDHRLTKTMDMTRKKRVARALGLGFGSAVILTPTIVVGLAGLAVRGAVFSYLQVPAEEGLGLAKRWTRRRRQRRAARRQALSNDLLVPAGPEVAVADLSTTENKVEGCASSATKRAQYMIEHDVSSSDSPAAAEATSPLQAVSAVDAVQLQLNDPPEDVAI